MKLSIRNSKSLTRHFDHYEGFRQYFKMTGQTKFCKFKRWPVKIHVVSGRVHRWEMLSQRISSGCSKERYNNGLWCCCSRKFCIYAISHGRHSCAKRRNFLQEAHSRRSKVTYYCGIFLEFFFGST